MGYIYKIENTTNNKIYIGKTTKTIEERWKEHCKNSKADKLTGRPLYFAMRKYGVDCFSIKEIEECSNDIINEREIYSIKFYESFENGYNATRGGDGGLILSDSKIEQIISLYNKGYCMRDIKKIVNCSLETVSFYIKKILNVSDEEVKLKGYYIRKKKREHIVNQYDLNKNFIASYHSYKEAQDSTGVWYTHISEVCRGKRKTAGGYIWENGG